MELKNHAKRTVYNIIKNAYNDIIRDHLPRRLGVYGGVPARDVRLFDFTDTIPNYKQGLVESIKDHTSEGDTAVLVGGGRGVSSVHLAEAGVDVHAYEAAEQMIPVAKETVQMAGVSSSVTFHHALVGEAVELYGDLADAEIIPPEQFDTGDVLILDCEGAETSILQGISDLPETVIVETHPGFDAPTRETRELLERRGYTITERVYEPDANPDKKVLTGKL